MAKIEQVVSSPSSASANTQPEQSAAKNKKRKLKEIQASAAGAGSDNDNDRSTEADSPTIKFKKLGKRAERFHKDQHVVADARIRFFYNCCYCLLFHMCARVLRVW